MKHSSLEPLEKRNQTLRPIIKEPSVAETKVKVIREQVDLTPITERLDRIEVEIAGFNRQKEEITKQQLEVLSLFAQALKQKVT